MPLLDCGSMDTPGNKRGGDKWGKVKEYRLRDKQYKFGM